MPRRQRPALLCVADTNSLIHMREIEVADKDLRLWLWDEFTVKLSEKISDEIQNHQKLAQGGIQRRCNQSKWDFKVQVDRLERAFLQPFYPDLDRDEDKGERHNCCVALEAVLTGEYGQVIFLTDELKATDPDRKGFLALTFNTFPIGQIWSSLDFVLYLFLRHPKRFRVQKAEDALRDINSRIGGKEGTPVQRFTGYKQKLYAIEETLAKLPDY